MSAYRYQQYRAALKTIPFTGTFMPYDWGGLPTTLPFTFAAYSQMFREFSDELANSINELTRYTHQLKAWRQVVDKSADKAKVSLAMEFIDPLGTIALNLPYVIRSRFIFAAAHLCHQAARAKSPESWKDDLPLDEEIYFAQADAAAASWKKYGKLKIKLERIGDKAYQAKSRDFRNTYNHRFSPHIVVGQTNYVTRNHDPVSGSVTYEFGGMEPLSLKVVCELLEQQCMCCYAAFGAFQILVHEHEQAIGPIVASTLAAMAASAAALKKAKAP